ncbi:SDR family NAD(P)-dependent oxidoreductase [Bdellovibrio sp. GT3]|uniref:SDR family NAD(P)-dependent oxidoreductase n=1 Tax=Bdellovibrio sp. GT3 TaxID=3136282 RepID=UPI0030F348D4
MSSWDLQGKTAVVCGASQGIGAATAQLLAQRGARVIALARNEEKLKALLASIPGEGHKYFAVDLADTAELKKLIPKISQEKIHILVNNSGGPKGGPLLEVSIEEFDAPIKAHLHAAHLLVQAVVPFMKSVNYGRIVNIISTSVKNPIPGLGVSNTVRGAMASWSKTLAGELGPFGITVNNMLPGYIRTGRIESLMGAAAQKTGNSIEEVEEQWIKTIPAGRIGDPREAAEGIAFLVSPAASYINGINLPVDGGRTPSL